MGGGAAKVQGVAAHIRPNLEEETRQPPSESAKQGDRWNEVALQAERFRKTFDRKGSVGIKTAVACLADFFHGMNELLGRRKLTHHTVDMGALQMHYFSSSEVSATSSRISAMEIAGRTRTNRKIRVTNMPMVPMNVAHSPKDGP